MVLVRIQGATDVAAVAGGLRALVLNAHIVGQGLRVVIEEMPNRFKRAGRPSTAFMPKRARIARCLLMHPQQVVSQQEIADATDMDPGFTSRLLRRLIDDELVDCQADGKVVVSRPELVLEAWAQHHDWNKHGYRRAWWQATWLGDLPDAFVVIGGLVPSLLVDLACSAVLGGRD